MKLYIYKGIADENVPLDVTHVIVDDSVTIIKRRAFYRRFYLVNVSMGDNVKRIEGSAFSFCGALRSIRLSTTLEYIGEDAFCACSSLEALFLPSTVKSIQSTVFWNCESLRLLILPNDINLGNVGEDFIQYTGIEKHLVLNADVNWSWGDDEERNRGIEEWLYHHMDEEPLHKLCCDSSISTEKINSYLNDHGNDSALRIETIHGMTSLHMLTMNPNAPADAISALFDSNMEAFFSLDNQQKIPLEYAREYNVGGLIGMIAGLCNHRNASVLGELDTRGESATKKRRI